MVTTMFVRHLAFGALVLSIVVAGRVKAFEDPRGPFVDYWDPICDAGSESVAPDYPNDLGHVQYWVCDCGSSGCEQAVGGFCDDAETLCEDYCDFVNAVGVYEPDTYCDPPGLYHCNCELGGQSGD